MGSEGALNKGSRERYGQKDVKKGKLVPEGVEGFQWTLETRGLRFESTQSEVFELSDQHIGDLGNGILTISWN